MGRGGGLHVDAKEHDRSRGAALAGGSAQARDNRCVHYQHLVWRSYQSLVVYRLVHAPVTNEDRAKAGFDSPPGRIFCWLSQYQTLQYAMLRLSQTQRRGQ